MTLKYYYKFFLRTRITYELFHVLFSFALIIKLLNIAGLTSCRLKE
jgi:hypothetical protein